MAKSITYYLYLSGHSGIIQASKLANSLRGNRGLAKRLRVDLSQVQVNNPPRVEGDVYIPISVPPTVDTHLVERALAGAAQSRGYLCYVRPK